MPQDEEPPRIVPDNRNLEELIFLARRQGKQDGPKKEYRIKHKKDGKRAGIESGSFATTYIGVPLDGSDEEIVIKILQEEINRFQQEREEFHDEVRLADGIHHDNIVDVLGTGYAITNKKDKAEPAVMKGQTIEYIAMEKMNMTLATALNTEHLQIRLDGKLIASIMSRVVGALEYADYHHGIKAHRDLHPKNILINFKGGGYEVKICDFGRARVIKDPEQLMMFTTQPPGRTEGKPGENKRKTIAFDPKSCIAPEVDDPRYQDNLLDVYSLGRIGTHLTLIYTTLHGNDRTIGELDVLFSKAAKNRNLQEFHKIKDLADFMDKVAATAGITHIHENPRYYWHAGDGMQGKDFLMRRIGKGKKYVLGLSRDIGEEFAKVREYVEGLYADKKDQDQSVRDAMAVVRKAQKELLDDHMSMLVDVKGFYEHLLSNHMSGLPDGVSIRKANFRDISIDPEKAEQLKKTIDGHEAILAKFPSEVLAVQTIASDSGCDIDQMSYHNLHKKFSVLVDEIRAYQRMLGNAAVDAPLLAENENLKSALESMRKEHMQAKKEFKDKTDGLMNRLRDAEKAKGDSAELNGTNSRLKEQLDKAKSRFRNAIIGGIGAVVVTAGLVFGMSGDNFERVSGYLGLDEQRQVIPLQQSAAPDASVDSGPARDEPEPVAQECEVREPAKCQPFSLGPIGHVATCDLESSSGSFYVDDCTFETERYSSSTKIGPTVYMLNIQEGIPRYAETVLQAEDEDGNKCMSDEIVRIRSGTKIFNGDYDARAYYGIPNIKSREEHAKRQSLDELLDNYHPKSLRESSRAKKSSGSGSKRPHAIFPGQPGFKAYTKVR